MKRLFWELRWLSCRGNWQLGHQLGNLCSLGLGRVHRPTSYSQSWLSSGNQQAWKRVLFNAQFPQILQRTQPGFLSAIQVTQTMWQQPAAGKAVPGVPQNSWYRSCEMVSAFPRVLAWQPSVQLHREGFAHHT